MSQHYCDDCRRQTWWSLCCDEHPSAKDDKIAVLEGQLKESHESIQSAARVCTELKHECDSLKQWISDLQSGMYVNCVYCGHQYGPVLKTPVSESDVLKAHIEICSKHPMSELKKRVAELERRERGYLSELKDYGETVARLRKEKGR